MTLLILYDQFSDGSVIKIYTPVIKYNLCVLNGMRGLKKWRKRVDNELKGVSVKSKDMVWASE